MESAKIGAATFLAVGFGIVCYIMLVVEPGMGFATPGDFLDPVKVVAGNGSPAWLVGNLIYLLIPVALVTLVRSSHDAIAVGSGVIAALLFLLLGSIGQVGMQLPSLVSSEQDLVSAVATTLPVRFAILKTTVVALGVFAWATTRAGADAGAASKAWRALGWVVLASSVLFMFVFVPVPLVFFVWAVALTVRQLGSARGGAENAPA